MAGAHADGVFIRVGTDPRNIESAYQQVVEGAKSAGRDPKAVKIGVIFHVAVEADAARATTIAKAIAAGYYEYSPFLFDNLGLQWNGASVEALKREVFPPAQRFRFRCGTGERVDARHFETVDRELHV